MNSGLKFNRITSLIILIGILVWLLRPPSTEFLNVPCSTVILDREGQLLSARIAPDGQWRFPISNVTATKFEQALITYEDQRFYYHQGVDPMALSRAIFQNISSRTIVSGASTLTMQLARLSRTPVRRNWKNKLIEINLALRLELWNSKKDILNWYTSLAPFGGNVVGLEAASWRYFNKSSEQLTWAEAAMMAVLPNAPSLIHVNKNRPKLLAKRDRLLYKLRDNGIIDQLEFEAALLEPLPETTYSLPNEAPHYLEYLKSRDGAKVYASNLQQAIQKQSAQVLKDFYPFWEAKKIYNAGAIILETKSGKIAAYHGNIRGTSEEPWVDVIQAPRSSGSILKPLLYAHQIDEGMISPIQLTEDIPTFISGFNPTNFHKSFSGAIPGDEALQRSLNVPAVRQLQKYGVAKFLTQLRNHGLSTLNSNADHYGLSLILGGGEVTLWDIAHVYQRLGADLLGERVDGDLSRAAIYQTFEALKGLVRPDESGNWQVMDSRFPVAWKTGTSYGHRDAWAVGVTPAYTIATWVGNADGEGRDGIIGVGTAGKLLFTLFDVMPQDDVWFAPPYKEMAYFNICKASGFLTSAICPDTIHLLLPNQVERTKVCPYHSIHYTNLEETVRVDPSCVANDALKRMAYFQLPPEMSTYYVLSHPEYMQLPPFAEHCVTATYSEDMTITYPLEDEIIYLPTDLNNTPQQLVARIAHRQAEMQLFWYLDNKYLGTTDLFHSMSISPEPGQHTLLVEDITGNRITRQFKVANRLHP